MKTYRGLLALLLILSFTVSLQANFIVIDEVVKNQTFYDPIEAMGKELSEKTGINLYMSLIKELDDKQSIIDYQKALIKTLKEPAVLLSFVENSKQVQIYADDKSLYKTFDKDQIMNPMAIWPFFNGAIIPVLSVRSKDDIAAKEQYSAAMFNGYAEITEQIAASKGITLDTAIGNSSRNVYKIMITALFFISVFTVWRLISDYLKRKREINESL